MTLGESEAAVYYGGNDVDVDGEDDNDINIVFDTITAKDYRFFPFLAFLGLLLLLFVFFVYTISRV